MTFAEASPRPGIDPKRWPDIAIVPHTPAAGCRDRAGCSGEPYGYCRCAWSKPAARASARARSTIRSCGSYGRVSFYHRLGAQRDDRFRRGLHGRRLDHRRPHRRADRVRCAHPRPGAGRAATAARRGAQPAAGVRRQHGRGRAAEHPPALRPVQRPVRPVPRRLDDLLRRPSSRATRQPPTTTWSIAQRAQDRSPARRGWSAPGNPSARDRHRMGRAGHSRCGAWGYGHLADHLERAGRHSLASASQQAGQADRVDVLLQDYRAPRAITTPSSASR